MDPEGTFASNNSNVIPHVPVNDECCGEYDTDNSRYAPEVESVSVVDDNEEIWKVPAEVPDIIAT